MNDLKIALANDAEIAVDSFSLPLHVVVNCESKADALDIWEQMTPENLEDVKVFEGGEKTGEFANVEITSVQFAMCEGSESVAAHFFMCGENRSESTEDDYVRAAKILLGEEE